MIVPTEFKIIELNYLACLILLLSLNVFNLVKSQPIQQNYYYQALNSFSSFDLINDNKQPNSNINNNNNNNNLYNDIEKKYVNSGQSVLLICDLPNNMPDGKVLFIKYDNRVLNSVSGSSGLDIREDTDDERYEIGQQYAWEWSLKINSISEEDSAIYVCKVGDVVIKRFEIIVRVPPRIKDDPTNQMQKSIREGASIEFSCFALGTPKPNITWFMINQFDNTLKPLPNLNKNVLRLENVTRYTPRNYQCRASNNIPPSDTRNLTFSVEFAPEIEIQSKYDRNQNKMVLNCSIAAYPLTNKNFWRKEGNYLNDGLKYEIKNKKINDFTFLSQLIIKYYDELDQGLYECSAENDLRVSKVVYNLKEEISSNSNNKKEISIESNDMIPIGSSNKNSNLHLNRKDDLNLINQNNSKHHSKSNRKGKLHNHQEPSYKKNRIFNPQTLGDINDSSSIYNLEYSQVENTKKNGQRKQHHLRNHKQNTTKSNLIDTSTAIDLNSKSPYIILINEDNSAKDLSQTKESSEANGLFSNNQISNLKTSNLNSNQDINELNASNSIFKFLNYKLNLLAFISFYFVQFFLVVLFVK